MKYFTIQELCKSNKAASMGIDNSPSQEVENNLKTLIEKVLDPIREIYGKPIKVNSGYRSLTLNKAVGGSSTSDHLHGFAADITGGSKEENKKIYNIIKDNCKFSQLINEYNYSWVHVSYNPNNLKQQELKIG